MSAAARKGRTNACEFESGGGRYGVQAAQRQLIRNQTRSPGTRHLAPRSEAPNLIKIRKQGVVVPGYATVDGAGLGAFAGMLPADQCAQQVMCAFKDFPHQQDRDAL